MTETHLRIGLIGTGGIARDKHIPGWQSVPQAEIVALADQSAAALQAASAACVSAPTTHTDYRAVLDDPRVNVVDICAPSALHAQITIEALSAGKHVLCEKPMATCRADAAAMLEALGKTDRRLMVAQHMRVDPSVRRLRRALARTPLGEVYYARAQWLRRRRLPGRPTFTQKVLSGGGPLYDLGVHMLDLAWWMIGCPRPVSVSGAVFDRLAKREGLGSEWGEWNPHTIDVEDFACGLIRFEGGGVLSLETSWLLFHNAAEWWQLQMYGDQAGALWPDCRIFGEQDQDPWSLQLEPGENFEGAPKVPLPYQPHHEIIRSFAASLLEDQPLVVPPEQSANIIAMLEALYRSAAIGGEVPVEAFPPGSPPTMTKDAKQAAR